MWDYPPQSDRTVPATRRLSERAWSHGGLTMRQSATLRPMIERLEPRQLLAAFDVLVFSRTAAFRHDSIAAGITAIQQLGAANNFSVTATENPEAFTDVYLAQYEAVVFL